jgi:hypothetical protein
MLDEELKRHRKRLELAINQVLSDSPEIKAAIHQIREGGYDAFLIVEATIGFNKTDGESKPASTAPSEALDLTGPDKKFLRSLRISPF